MRKTLLTATALGLLAFPQASMAQSETDQSGDFEPARGCLQDLRNFGEQMNDDGYWLAGYRRWGPGTYGITGMGAAVGTTGVAGPYGEAGMGTSMSPGYQIRSLYAAARVLGERGDKQGCENVLSDLKRIYGDYSGRLEEAGVEPGSVTAWRQDQIAQARPVNEVQGALTVDNVIGAEVRNGRDEYLGDAEDVLFNPESGGIEYVLVEYGGFLGLGEAARLVPYDMLAATPGFDTLVLDVSESKFENAPSIQPSELTHGDNYDRDEFQQIVSNVDTYWDGATKTE